MDIDALQLLRLLQLADSALPIGSTAHSFGLETLTEENELSVEQLEIFLQGYLAEAGTLEAAFCRRSYSLASQIDATLLKCSCVSESATVQVKQADQFQGNQSATQALSLTQLNGITFEQQWLALNNDLSAFKTARESRVASATLGRRFLQLAAGLEESARLQQVLSAAKSQGVEVHYSIAFGLIGRHLGVDETATVLAYLQQSLMGLVSACQRLLPLGQSRASTILWRLKTTLIETAHRSENLATHPQDGSVFTPLLDMGSMRHPNLTTRLFIS